MLLIFYDDNIGSHEGPHARQNDLRPVWLDYTFELLVRRTVAYELLRKPMTFLGAPWGVVNVAFWIFGDAWGRVFPFGYDAESPATGRLYNALQDNIRGSFRETREGQEGRGRSGEGRSGQDGRLGR